MDLRVNVKVVKAKRSGYSGFVNEEEIAVGTLKTVAKEMGDEVRDRINALSNDATEAGGD